MAISHGSTGCVRVLLDAGAHPDEKDVNGRKAIYEAYDLEIFRLLVAAGADLNDANLAMRHALLGLDDSGIIDVTREKYEAGKRRRFGARNPERIDAPFWRAMVRTRLSAWVAQITFDDRTDERDEQVWCNRRFGQRITLLPDGRFVEIGGEHEDWYTGESKRW